MVKHQWVCVCDVCGKTVPAAGVIGGGYNETNYVRPPGWVHGATNDIDICPDCGRKLGIGILAIKPKTTFKEGKTV